MDSLLRLLWLLLISLLSLSSNVSADEKSLFGSNSQVTQLNIDNFDQTVYNQKKYFFVEFYSSWCGACIQYAPHYESFANEIKGWKPVFEVAAINCADDKNIQLCRAHAIDAFPTVKYFKYMSRSHDDGVKYNGDKHDMVNLPLDVAQLVRDDWLKRKPSELPNFDYESNTSTLHSLWRSAGSQAKLLAVIVESHPPRQAWAAKINFAHDKRVHVALVSSSDPLAKELDATEVGDLPKFYLFTRAQPKTPVYTSGAKVTWLEIQEKITQRLIDETPASAITAPPVVEGHQARKGPAVNWTQFEVQLVDLTSAMYYILKDEIPRRQIIEGENLNALKLWIHMLKKYAPGTVPIRRLFYRLDEWLASAHQVSSAQWIAEVDRIQSDLGFPLPTNMTWIACRGSKPYLRGYSCGLWTLLHTVTVEAYKNEESNPSFDGEVELVEPIHQFIYRFFSCEECGKHFHTHVLKTNKSTVKRPGDVILWLWRTHNIVNKVLKGKESDDPAFPKQQFPPASLCHSCRDADGNFNDNAVLQFLVKYYSDIKTDSPEQSSLYKVSEFEDGELKSDKSKRFNPKFAVGSDKVDQLEESEQRLRRENVDASPQRRWKRIESSDFVKPYDSSSGNSFFYLLWLSIAALAVFVAYMKYRRNRTKFWKTFYYYNDYKLCPWSLASYESARKFAV